MRLSIVIPVFNESDAVLTTVRSVQEAIRRAPGFHDAEFVVADDGSTPPFDAGPIAAETPCPVRLARLEANSGRFAARRAGAAQAGGELLFFVDAGVEITPESLAFVEQRIAAGRTVWNAHTLMSSPDSAYTMFWTVVSSLAFGAYVDEPRETSFGLDDFDRFPKGTTCFLAPRELLLDAFAAFTSAYRDTRNANDDGPLIRYVASRERINIAPGFACIYSPRQSLRSFVRHAFHRGVVFVDGHGRRESRFFPIVVGFFPLSVALAFVVARRPVVAPAAVVAAALAGGGAAALRGRPARQSTAFGLLAPVYALAHGIGMWKGLVLAARAKAARA